MLAFDEPTHRYTWNGQPVPGVTEVIRSALGDPFANFDSETLTRKRQIGIAAHRAVELDDAGKLNQDSVHPAVLPYLEAWRAFRRESKFQPLMSETKEYSGQYGYAGTFDALGLLRDDLAVVDFKTGLPGPMAALQTAAYAPLIPDSIAVAYPPPVRIRRFALRALPTGRYKFDEYTNPADWRDFLACLAVYRLKKRIDQ